MIKKTTSLKPLFFPHLRAMITNLCQFFLTKQERCMQPICMNFKYFLQGKRFLIHSFVISRFGYKYRRPGFAPLLLFSWTSTNQRGGRFYWSNWRQSQKKPHRAGGRGGGGEAEFRPKPTVSSPVLVLEPERTEYSGLLVSRWPLMWENTHTPTHTHIHLLQV